MCLVCLWPVCRPAVKSSNLSEHQIYPFILLFSLYGFLRTTLTGVQKSPLGLVAYLEAVNPRKVPCALCHVGHVSFSTCLEHRQRYQMLSFGKEVFWREQTGERCPLVLSKVIKQWLHMMFCLGR